MSSKDGKGGKEKELAAHLADPRFARLHTDPRFLRPNREDGKVVLDDRFKGLLSDDLSGKGSRKRRPKLDKYGRPAQHDASKQSELQRLYRTAEDNDQGQGSDEEEGRLARTKPDGRAVDFARGEGQLESSGDEESSKEGDGDEEGEKEDDDSEESSDEEDVVIGSALARRRESKRNTSDDKEVEVEADQVIPAEQLAIHASQSDLAKLDRQAERAVRREAKEARKRHAEPKPKFAGDTHRLAAVNMDWDHIRAVDLFKVFSSIVSSGGASSAASGSRRATQGTPVQGRCLSVRIYPSEFGRKRMAKETIEGPPRAIFKAEGDGDAASTSNGKRKKRNGKKAKRGGVDDDDDDDDSENEELFELDEGGDFDEEALRQYQLERLRYYYAIVDFDSASTARYVLNEIDGSEMEHSANMFDLSFVPDGMAFPDEQAPKDEPDNEGWRDEANEAQLRNDGASYDGVKFTTDALRHSKVKLTWDADDPQRSKITRQAVQQALTADQLRDDDFKAYLASASEDSDADNVSNEDAEGDEAAGGLRDKMRARLGLGGEGSADAESSFGKARSGAFADGRKSRTTDGPREGEMQITFMPGLSEAAERRRKGVKAPLNDAEDETTLEKYKRKQKEKRDRRKRRGDEDESEEEGEGGVRVDAGANGNTQDGFDDPFFASDGDNDEEVDFDAALQAEQKKKEGKSKNDRKGEAAARRVQDDTGDGDDNRRELELMVDSDDDRGESGAGHFSLKDILQAEKAADGKKKGRWAKKKEKKAGAKKGDDEVQAGFAIDVQDARFNGLYGDHRFALDPSHPNFIKTKNTQRLVDERRKQDKARQRGSRGAKKERRAPEEDSRAALPSSGATDGQDLSRLVQSVKKRAASMGDAAPKRPPHKKSRKATTA